MTPESDNDFLYRQFPGKDGSDIHKPTEEQEQAEILNTLKIKPSMTPEKYEAAENVLLKQQVDYWDWLRCKGTTPNVYNAIIKAMDEYASLSTQALQEAESTVKNLKKENAELKMISEHLLVSRNEYRESFEANKKEVERLKGLIEQQYFKYYNDDFQKDIWETFKTENNL